MFSCSHTQYQAAADFTPAGNKHITTTLEAGELMNHQKAVLSVNFHLSYN